MSIRVAINHAKNLKNGMAKARLEELSTEQWDQIESSLVVLRDAADDALRTLREVRGAE